MDEDCEIFLPIFFFLYLLLIFVCWQERRLSRLRRLDREQNPGAAMQPLWRRWLRRNQPHQLLRGAERPSRTHPPRTRTSNQDRTREWVINFSSTPIPNTSQPGTIPQPSTLQPGQQSQQPGLLQLEQQQPDMFSSEERQVRIDMFPPSEQFDLFQHGEQPDMLQPGQQHDLFPFGQLTQQTDQQPQQTELWPSEQQQPDMFQQSQQPDLFPSEEQPQQLDFRILPPPPYDTTAIGFAPPVFKE